MALIAGLALAQQPAGSPLTAAFTYQGRLSSSGAPYTGPCDFQFGLWDAGTGGVQVGPTQTLTNAPLVDGYFTVQLDWGADKFFGEQRWLDISVRCPAGIGTYIPLTPRQMLTASPQALFAMHATWPGLVDVPPGFADGIDNDTLYGAGPGLTISGTIFSADTAYLQRRVTGACGSGFAIREVNQDGSVTCEPVGGGGGDAWLLTGNSGTVPGTNFLGTTDSAALVFKVNNERAFRLESTPGSPNVIGGIVGNWAYSGVYRASIGGGGDSTQANVVTDIYGTVGGGVGNQAGDGAGTIDDRSYCTVGGGRGNTASGDNSTIGGGWYNEASSLQATIGGGQDNLASGGWATIGGGKDNATSANSATVGGGEGNTAVGEWATVGGGYSNTASGASFVGGGEQNAATGAFATVSGGGLNTASGSYYATVGGGTDNTASGKCHRPGGDDNLAQGDYSLPLAGQGQQPGLFRVGRLLRRRRDMQRQRPLGGPRQRRGLLLHQRRPYHRRLPRRRQRHLDPTERPRPQGERGGGRHPRAPGPPGAGAGHHLELYERGPRHPPHGGWPRFPRRLWPGRQRDAHHHDRRRRRGPGRHPGLYAENGAKGAGRRSGGARAARKRRGRRRAPVQRCLGCRSAAPSPPGGHWPRGVGREAGDEGQVDATRCMPASPARLHPAAGGGPCARPVRRRVRPDVEHGGRRRRDLFGGWGVFARRDGRPAGRRTAHRRGL